MMAATVQLRFLCLFLLWTVFSQAQDIRIKQSELPYFIPIIEKPSQGEGMVYRWMENDQEVSFSNDIYWSIPQGKESGIYVYTHQVRCVGCTDWMESNSFAVEVYNDEITERSSPFKVVFSPQREVIGFVEELIETIDLAERKIEIAIYSADHYDIDLALKRAVDRGVQIRMLYEGALKDRNQKESTFSHQLEQMGIDVKYVNKTNHHKFIISDDSLLITSSGNWNNKANWERDESALSISDPEIVLRYRAEFELLWNNSREFGKAYSYIPVRPDSLLSLIVDNPNVDAVFTTSNYRISNSAANGPTFSKTANRQNLADRIVEQINRAEKSIKIAANYLRSRPISEALIKKKRQNPDLEVKVFTDQNEYITKSFNAYQINQRSRCLADAQTPAKERDCLEKNFLYSYELISAGIDLRFKIYSYKWHYTTAKVMHHKYAIFDDETVAVGSYNYSYNSETNSMENLLIFNRKASLSTVEKYIANFDEIWNLGRVENYYNDVLTQLQSENRYVPLTFLSMALNQEEYTHLKQQIEKVCPAVKSTYFKNNGQLYSTYLKGIKMEYDTEAKVVTKLEDARDKSFAIDYNYNSNHNVVSVDFRSNDGLAYSKTYQYDSSSNLTAVETPVFKADISYFNNEVNTVNFGQGNHRWFYRSLLGKDWMVVYNAPNRSNHSKVIWSDLMFPKSLTDAKNRSLSWTVDSHHNLKTAKALDRHVDFTNKNSGLDATTSDGNRFLLELNSLNNYTVTTDGVVRSTIGYGTQVQRDKKQAVSIQINSENSDGTSANTAHMSYLLDVYGRTIKAADFTIIRTPFSGEITSISNGVLEETRTYNLWSLLVTKEVKYSGEPIYRANYQYDGLKRIKQVEEVILDRITQFTYQYDSKGQLSKVLKNDLTYENYTYDDFGNRTILETANNRYSYSNNQYNQTVGYSWSDSDLPLQKEFKYNEAGQLQKAADKINSNTDYHYDVFGNLLTVVNGEKNLEFVYDAFDRKIATYENGALREKWIYGIGMNPLVKLNQENGVDSTFWYVDHESPLLMHRGNLDYYIISDIRGSVKMVVNLLDGKVMQSMDYDSYGKVVSDSNPGFTPFGFCGGLYDNQTKLVHFGIRDYLTEIGKWTTEDPKGFLGGHFNYYTYVGNDPINFKVRSRFDQLNSRFLDRGQGYNSSIVFRNVTGAAGKGKMWKQFIGRSTPLISDFVHQNSAMAYSVMYPVNRPYFIHGKINNFYRSQFLVSPFKDNRELEVR